jgi:hypothetical protein
MRASDGHAIVRRVRRSALVTPLLAAIVVVLAFSVVAAMYAWLVPLGLPTDEPSHLAYAHLVADHVALPLANVPEKQQPPLYYLLAAGLLRAGVGDQALRLLTVILGAGTIAATMLGASRLLPERPWLAVGAGALVAGLPIVQAGSGAITDDPLAWLVGAFIVLLFVVVARDGTPTRGRALSVGMVIGIGLLSKQTVWGMCVVLAVLVVWRWWGRWRPRLVALVSLPPLGIAGWWFVRNLLTFHQLVPPLSPITNKNQYLRLGELRTFVSETVRSLSGPTTTTGLVPRSGWAAVLTWLVATTLVALSALVVLQVFRRYKAFSSGERIFVVAAASACVVVGAAYVANSVVLDLQPQVRYLLVAAAIPGAAWSWVLAQPTAHPIWRRVAIGAATILGFALLSLDIDSLRVAASIH